MVKKGQGKGQVRKWRMMKTLTFLDDENVLRLGVCALLLRTH